MQLLKSAKRGLNQITTRAQVRGISFSALALLARRMQHILDTARRSLNQVIMEAR
jgi:hypothetical protein